MRLNEVCPHCKKQTATFWVRRDTVLALYKCLREKCGKLHEQLEGEGVLKWRRVRRKRRAA